MENRQKIIIIVAAAILVMMAGIGFGFWPKKRQTPSVPSTQTKEISAPTLGEKIFEKTQKPLQDQVPEANPFKKQKNPLDVIYKNPFK